ncbi:MAG: chemotaxis protein CheW [Planctomycetota bacterium]
MDAELLVEFVEESREHLSDIETQLLSIEVMGADINDDLVNTVFRAIHSIKGAAGFLGLTEINGLSHRLENVLGKVRDHELVPTPFNVDVMLKSADRLMQLIDSVESSNETSNEDLCDKLDKVLQGEEGGETTDRVEETLDAVDAAVESIDEAPAADVAPSEANADTKEVAAKLDEPAPAKKPAAAAVPKANDKPSKPAGKSGEIKGSSEGLAIEPTIRVNVRVLDQLMNLAGELVLSRNQLLRSMTESSSNNQLEKIASGLDQVTTELQETIMQTRMQPIGNVFNKFPRVIRDLSSSLGKKISLKVEGNEVETDKTIVEAIADPLTHLIRNSCDHGVEQPEDRVAAGKPETGTVHLKAFHQAGKVMIEIIDDGAGMDPEKLRNKAVEKGVLTAEAAAALNDHDAVNLIFAPGFSTAEAITAVSGRGVGMDVVRTNIEKIGGSVEVESTLGEGSVIRITLPLTLAIIPSMIVSLGDRPFALPQVNIVELVQCSGSDKRIERVNNAEVLRLRGSLIPLVRLNSLLSIEHDESKPRENQQVIVVESGRSVFGIAVDRVLDSEEIVVKPLSKHLSNLPLFAGSTILGDGRVAMILDISGITLQGNIQSDSDSVTEEPADTTKDVADLQRMVLFSINKTDHFGISMDVVRRIERVKIDEIEVIGDRKVLKYRGSTLPVMRVQDALDTADSDQPEYIHVIVYAVYGREVGLVAPYLDDITDCDMTFSDSSPSETGTVGLVVIDERTTRVLDLYGMTESARPEWFTRTETADEPAEKRNAHICVAEDSKFFRNFLINTLVEEGHTVDAFADGQLAFEHLETTDTHYDLILTDIEMPNLDGFGLTKKARAIERYADKPIIALTSLADKTSMERGIQAGVTDYQIKMNKPELLGAIQRLANKKHSETTKYTNIPSEGDSK